jgi:hypothetical protein
MSSADDGTGMTIQQRSAQATHELSEGLGLGPVSPGNLKYLALALMLVASEEIARNPDFSERIRSLYESLLPQKGSARNTSGAKKPWHVHLTPIGTTDELLLDPYGPPNPFALQQLYGDEQLPLALGQHSPSELRGAVAIVQERYPGTKPKSMSKAAIIEYIVKLLTSGS